MATEPAAQPRDETIDLSDIPETDFSKGVRGQFHPRRLELEREVRRLREDNGRLYAALQRMAHGMHAGDVEDAPAALAEASALLSELAPPH